MRTRSPPMLMRAVWRKVWFQSWRGKPMATGKLAGQTGWGLAAQVATQERCEWEVESCAIRSILCLN